MKIQIISPGVYTYGSMVLGGILRDRGHSVNISKDLRHDGDVIILSLFSTLQLLDPAIREFVSKAGPPVYCGGPVGICPEMVLGELDVDAVAMCEGEGIIARLVEAGPEGVPGVAYREGEENHQIRASQDGGHRPHHAVISSRSLRTERSWR
jgi:hypothetical protein